MENNQLQVQQNQAQEQAKQGPVISMELVLDQYKQEYMEQSVVLMNAKAYIKQVELVNLQIQQQYQELAKELEETKAALAKEKNKRGNRRNERNKNQKNQ